MSVVNGKFPLGAVDVERTGSDDDTTNYEKEEEAADDEACLAIGVEEAQALAATIRACAQGLYLMPPFGSAAIAARVMAALG